MILAGGENKGKRLVKLIEREIKANGTAQVAAVSERGVQLINKAGQRLANTFGMKLEATPSEGTVTINGTDRVALVVTIKVVTPEDEKRIAKEERAARRAAKNTEASGDGSNGTEVSGTESI